MFGDIPYEKLLPHDWRRDVVKLGELSADFMAEITDGLWCEPISVEINRRVMDKSYPQSTYMNSGLKGKSDPWWKVW